MSFVTPVNPDDYIRQQEANKNEKRYTLPEDTYKKCFAMTTSSMFTKQCENLAHEFAPYCSLHTPVKIGTSKLGGQGVFVRGWNSRARGYPDGLPDVQSGPLPVHTIIGEYTVGTDIITEEERETSNSDYTMTMDNGVIYDADGPSATARGSKVIAAMVNDCLPINENDKDPNKRCKTNCHFDEFGRLFVGKWNFKTGKYIGDGRPIAKDNELYAEYGNKFWFDRWKGPKKDFLRPFSESFYPYHDQRDDVEPALKVSRDERMAKRKR